MSFGFIALAFSSKKDMIATIDDGHLYMREENARAIKPKDMIATID
jgi:predicted nucleic acid-binding protein